MTTRFPKDGATKPTQRGYIFDHAGEPWQVIDDGPVPVSVWAVKVGSQETAAFKLNGGSVSHQLTADMLPHYNRSRTGTAGRIEYDYGDLVNWIPFKLLSDKDFR